MLIFQIQKLGKPTDFGDREKGLMEACNLERQWQTLKRQNYEAVGLASLSINFASTSEQIWRSVW